MTADEQHTYYNKWTTERVLLSCIGAAPPWRGRACPGFLVTA